MLDECVAISLIGNFKKGSTCCMSSSSVTFLGHILGESLQALCQQHLRRSRKNNKSPEINQPENLEGRVQGVDQQDLPCTISIYSALC